MFVWVLKNLESPNAKNVVTQEDKEVEESLLFSKKQNV